MTTHESSVNYQNLIRDLAEMYPLDVAEVVVVELVANSLDAGATRILIDLDANQRALVVEDNGEGMNASQFDQYHDFAAGLKTRGTGIGFAGVGAKISFNIADRVITETRSNAFSAGSNWYLQSNKRLLWDDLSPTHLQANGTRVEVQFKPDFRLPYASAEDLIKLLRRHYLPLTDTDFLDLYQSMGIYSSDLKFVVNKQILQPGKVTDLLSLDKVKNFFPKKAGKRIGYGVFGVAAQEYPLGANICGVLLCTRGKVIKPDLFNQFPGEIGPRLLGLVEIPGFVDFLTTSKTDFIRSLKHRQFESLYNPVRQEFKAWLGQLGVQTLEVAETDEATKLERELRKLIGEVPELADFFGFRAKKSVLRQTQNGTTLANSQEGVELTFPVGEGTGGENHGGQDIGDEPGEALVEDQKGGIKPAEPISRIGKKGPKIGFASAPDRLDLAWVDGNSILINASHPSYVKAHSDAARRLHNLFAIGSAIQRFMASDSESPDFMFVDRMMAAWGKR